MKAEQAITRRRDVLAAVEEYEARLTRYALRLLSDLDLARDAVQHAFVRLCDEPPLAEDRLAAWLFAVCRNKAFDYLRKSRRDENLAGAAFDSLMGREPDPADVAENGDQAAWVLRLRRVPAHLASSAVLHSTGGKRTLSCSHRHLHRGGALHESPSRFASWPQPGRRERQ